MSTIKMNYGYKINLSFINGSTVEEIDSANIKMLVIDYDYEKSHAPTALMDITLGVKLFNNMIKNRANSKLLLEVQKFDKNAVTKMTKTIIKKQLSYLMSNYSYEYDADTEEYQSSYKMVTIGLFDSDAINDDRKIINNLYRNTNMMTMVANELSKFKLIIEPFDNNKAFDVFYIMPQEGIHKFLSYMNSHCAFYSTNFKFFQDWNGYTYILSNKGKGIDIGDGMYTTVKLELTTDTEFGGVESDTTQELYTIKCSEDEFNQYQNNVTDNLINQIYAVSSDGSKHKNDLDINPINGSKSKPKVIRVREGNEDYAKAIGNELELTADCVNIITSHTDLSILVPYKEFIIKNKQELADKDGKYILSSKKEVFTQDSDYYRTDAILTFKKIKS